MADYSIENHGTIYLVRSNNLAALAHLREHTAGDTSWFGRALAVEHRYIAGLVTSLQEEGFTVD